MFAARDWDAEELDGVRRQLQPVSGVATGDDWRDGELGAAQCGPQLAVGEDSGEYLFAAESAELHLLV